MDQKPISSTRIRPAFFFYATEAGAKLTTNARNQHPLLHCCNTRHTIDGESPVRMRSSLVIPNAEDQDKITSRDPAGKPAEGRGTMDELIGRLAAKAGIDDAVAEKTIGIILGFLR